MTSVPTQSDDGLAVQATRLSEEAANLVGEPSTVIIDWWRRIRKKNSDLPAWVFEEACHFVFTGLVHQEEKEEANRIDTQFKEELDASERSRSEDTVAFLNRIGDLAAALGEANEAKIGGTTEKTPVVRSTGMAAMSDKRESSPNEALAALHRFEKTVRHFAKDLDILRPKVEPLRRLVDQNRNFLTAVESASSALSVLNRSERYLIERAFNWIDRVQIAQAAVSAFTQMGRIVNTGDLVEKHLFASVAGVVTALQKQQDLARSYHAALELGFENTLIERLALRTDVQRIARTIAASPGKRLEDAVGDWIKSEGATSAYKSSVGDVISALRTAFILRPNEEAMEQIAERAKTEDLDSIIVLDEDRAIDLWRLFLDTDDLGRGSETGEFSIALSHSDGEGLRDRLKSLDPHFSRRQASSMIEVTTPEKVEIYAIPKRRVELLKWMIDRTHMERSRVLTLVRGNWVSRGPIGTTITNRLAVVGRHPILEKSASTQENE